MPTVPLNTGYPFSLRSFTGNGTTSTFAVDFPYLDRAHVKLYLNGTLQTTGFSFVTDGTIQFTLPPAVGVAILIRRETPVVSPLVVFSNPSTLTAENLNRNARQALYVLQEQADILLGDIPVLDDITQALADALQAVVDARAARDTASSHKDAAAASASAAAASAASSLAIKNSLAANYDIIFSVPYLPGNGESFGEHVCVRDFILPAGAAGSFAGTRNPNTEALTFNIERTAGATTTVVGTGIIPANSNQGFLTVSTAVTFSIGNVLTLRLTSSTPNAPSTFAVTVRSTLVT